MKPFIVAGDIPFTSLTELAAASLSPFNDLKAGQILMLSELQVASDQDTVQVNTIFWTRLSCHA